MNYEIIKSEAKLEQFVNWLPTLLPNETYYFALFCRKKYYPILKSDKTQLKRFVSRKELIVSKIRQLECAIGSYKQDHIEIPNGALSLYVTSNPRNMEAAAKNSLKRFADLVTREYSFYNPQSEVLNELQKSAGTKHFFDLDFDNVEMDPVLNEIDKVLPGKYDVIKTKGGFHVLVKLAELTGDEKKTWHKHVTSLPGCDVRGDNLIPVPGCCQADFTPQLIERKWMTVSGTHPSQIPTDALNEL